MPATTPLRFIAIIKLVKGVLFVAIGLGAFQLINKDLAETARTWTMHLRIDPENHYARLLIERITNISAARLRHFGLLSFLFATDLFIEGIGLWLNKNWAKYMVLVATGFFIPFETYACIHHFSGERLTLFLVNVAVVAYIGWVLARQRRAQA